MSPSKVIAESLPKFLCAIWGGAVLVSSQAFSQLLLSSCTYFNHLASLKPALAAVNS